MKALSELLKYLIKNEKILFFFLIALVLLERVYVFLNFAILYTDSDQILIWQIAKDFKQGIFHAPCFYGQSYNPNFEPFFALPFLFLGMDYSVALPFTTSIMGIAPFLILSFYLYKKSEPLYGLLPLFAVLLLAPEFGMLTSISRGFVSGIFFAVIGFVLVLFHTASIARFIGAAFFGIGLYANPNCLLLFPFLLPFLWDNRINFIRKVWPMASGFILGSSLLFFNAAFYAKHPDLVIHPSPQLNYSFDHVLTVLGQLDNYFDFVSPLFWRFGWISLFLFVLMGFRLWRKERGVHFYTLSISFVLILLTFSVSKVVDGTNSVFFSGSRMYLAYPFVLVFMAMYFMGTLNIIQKEKFTAVLIILTCILLPIKIIGYDFFLNQALSGKKNAVVQVIPVEKLRKTCTDIFNFGQGKTEVIIANTGNSPEQTVAYGCSCLLPDFPATLIPLYERRVWLMPEWMNRIPNRVLIYGQDTSVWNRIQMDHLSILDRDQSRGWMLLENQLKIADLLNETGIKGR